VPFLKQLNSCTPRRGGPGPIPGRRWNRPKKIGRGVRQRRIGVGQETAAILCSPVNVGLVTVKMMEEEKQRTTFPPALAPPVVYGYRQFAGRKVSNPEIAYIVIEPPVETKSIPYVSTSMDSGRAVPVFPKNLGQGSYTW